MWCGGYTILPATPLYIEYPHSGNRLRANQRTRRRSQDEAYARRRAAEEEALKQARQKQAEQAERDARAHEALTRPKRADPNIDPRTGYRKGSERDRRHKQRVGALNEESA